LPLSSISLLLNPRHSGKMITDDEVLDHLKAINNKMFLFTYYLANGMLAFYRLDFEGAIKIFEQAQENVLGVVGMMTNAQVLAPFFSLLSCFLIASHLI